MTPAARAADALYHLADAIDAAGPTPGPATAALLAEDRREAAAALRDLSASMPEGIDRDGAAAQSRLLARADAWSCGVATPDTMRRWARGWRAVARAA